jgi:hypothetical protein
MLAGIRKTITMTAEKIFPRPIEECDSPVASRAKKPFTISAIVAWCMIK